MENDVIYEWKMLMNTFKAQKTQRLLKKCKKKLYWTLLKKNNFCQGNHVFVISVRFTNKLLETLVDVWSIALGYF